MNGHKGTRIVADINGSRCVFDSCEVALRRKLPGRQNPPPRKSAGTRERPVCVCRTTDAISRRPVRNHKSGSTDVNKVFAAKHLRMQLRGTMTSTCTMTSTSKTRSNQTVSILIFRVLFFIGGVSFGRNWYFFGSLRVL